MSTDTDAQPTQSLPSRLVSRPRSPWITVGLGLVLILVPLAAAYVDGMLADLIQEGHLRPVLLPPIIIIYILAIAPVLDRMQKRVIGAFRRLVLVDDEEFAQLVGQASRLNPIAEAVAFGAGAAFGLWIGLSTFSGEGISWLTVCLALLTSFMFGLLIWTIYGAIAGTRLTAELHRQPLRIDIFDVEPFEPIGRLSLAVSLAILGGVVLALIFGLARDTLYDWRNWLIYVVLALVSVLIFFLNMRDTHRVLADEKERELDTVQEHILQASRTLMKCLDGGESAGSLGAEINALVAYEKRVQAARTWPYNTTMLRTLFMSVIIPAGAAAAQAIFERLTK
jgi:hypothetical protein